MITATILPVTLFYRFLLWQVHCVLVSKWLHLKLGLFLILWLLLMLLILKLHLWMFNKLMVVPHFVSLNCFVLEEYFLVDENKTKRVCIFSKPYACFMFVMCKYFVPFLSEVHVLSECILYLGSRLGCYMVVLFACINSVHVTSQCCIDKFGVWSWCYHKW